LRRTIVARTVDEIAGLRHQWERLHNISPATIFQSFTWNATAARVFADREHAHVVYDESDAGSALIPAAIDSNRRRISLLGETLFDYRDVLGAGDEQVLKSAWSRVAQNGLRFSAGALRNDSPLSVWKDFELTRFYGAPLVSPREISADQFASEHNRLRRFFRRLERMDVHLHCHSGVDSQLVAFIYQQKGSQPAETGDNLFSDQLRQKFMVEVCRASGTACEIFTLESAGMLVAAVVTFRDRHIVRFYTIYFDRRWARYSPGMVLIYEVTRRSLAAGLECDYMTGEHEYKTRLATSIVPMYWVEASAEMLAGRDKYRPALAA
jgi:CelD/BcsL family acetyltransferase involved in cellulose biosynthesis